MKYIYQQFNIGVCRVIKTCASLGFIIKKDVVEKLKIKQGEEYIVILLKRNPFSDEITKESINKATATDTEMVELMKQLKQRLSSP